MLDNENHLQHKDPHGALQLAATLFEQTSYDARVWNPEHDDREITGIVVVGMGGSALAALLAKVWLADDLTIPFEVVRDYDLPAYVNRNTLLIGSSYSGNTEETLSAMEQAERLEAQLGIVASGGQLIDCANEYNIAHVNLPDGLQPRMAQVYELRGLIALLENFGVVRPGKNDEIADLYEWLGQESKQWEADAPTDVNLAKQLAESAVGKTAVFYGGPLTAPLAYKWKISWNETAKNTAFWNQYPEFDHNEFMGWTSHPVEKPFAVFDLVSGLEHPQILKRFQLSDRLLSGKRPHAQTIELRGDTLIAQLLWGAILADFTSIYLAILNGVDPVPVELIERLKEQLGN